MRRKRRAGRRRVSKIIERDWKALRRKGKSMERTTPIIPCNPNAAETNAKAAKPYPLVQDGSPLDLWQCARKLFEISN